MRWQCIGLVLAMAVLGGSVSANGTRLPEQRWTEIRTQHFAVFTDASAGEGRGIAMHFEQIRAVFRAALPGVRVDPSEPVRILAVRDRDDFRQLLPEFWGKPGEIHPSGFFVGGNGRYYLALQLDSTGQHDHLFYHEYVHLLESLNFPNLPVWLSEGLADFYGSVRFFGDKTGIGYPIEPDVQLLEKAEMIPLARLLAVRKSSPDYNDAKMAKVFYAESWALTDYLFTADGGARRPAIFRYLSLVSKGSDSVDAAQKAFGNLDRLEADLSRFLRENKFPYDMVKAGFSGKDSVISSRSLSAAAVDSVVGDFMVLRGQPSAARTWLNKAIGLDPKLAAPYESLGRLALGEGKRAEALHYFDRAAALHSQSYLAWYQRGMLSLRERKGPGAIKQAEADFEECIKLNPSFPEGYRALADLKSLFKEDPERAQALAQRAVALGPGDAENHLLLGIVLLRLGKRAEATAEGQRALQLAHTEGVRWNTLQFLSTVREAQAAAEKAQPVPVSETSSDGGA